MTSPKQGRKKKSSPARRAFVLIAGICVIAVGIALIFLPGPAFIVIPAGFALLATEFAWAQKQLDAIKQMLPKKLQRKLKTRKPHTT